MHQEKASNSLYGSCKKLTKLYKDTCLLKYRSSMLFSFVPYILILKYMENSVQVPTMTNFFVEISRATYKYACMLSLWSCGAYWFFSLYSLCTWERELPFKLMSIHSINWKSSCVQSKKENDESTRKQILVECDCVEHLCKEVIKTNAYKAVHTKQVTFMLQEQYFSPADGRYSVISSPSRPIKSWEIKST